MCRFCGIIIDKQLFCRLLGIPPKIPFNLGKYQGMILIQEIANETIIIADNKGAIT